MKIIKMFMDMVGYDIYKHLRMLLDVITYHTCETFNYSEALHVHLLSITR